jgi:hypothetical protein
MKISTQLGWMIGLGVLSFTLVGVGTASKPRQAQAAAETAPLCRPAQAPEGAPSLPDVASVTLQGVGTGGAGGSGPPVSRASSAPAGHMAAAKIKAPTTELVFFPLWARQ